MVMQHTAHLSSEKTDYTMSGYPPVNTTDPIDNLTRGLGTGLPAAGVSVFTPSIMFALGVGGNMLALCFLCRARHSSDKGVFYRLVLALALTDMLGIVTTSPVVIAVYQNHLHWLGGRALCDYFGFMLTFAGVSTPLLIGAMAIERYIAVCYPLHYNTRVNTNYYRGAVAGSWAVSFACALMPILGFGRNVLQFPGTWCFFDFRGTEPEDQAFAYLYACLVLCVVVLIIACNVLVIIALVRAHQKTCGRMVMRRTELASGASRGRINPLHLQMIAMLVTIMCVFAVCWTPLLVRIVINQSHTQPINRYADLLAIRLASWNQILDPWVYIFLRRQLFRQIKNLFLRVTCQKVEHKPRSRRQPSLPLPDLIIERNQGLLTCNSGGNCFCFRSCQSGAENKKLQRHNSNFSTLSTRATNQTEVCDASKVHLVKHKRELYQQRTRMSRDVIEVSEDQM